MARQLRLSLERPSELSRDQFIVGPSNAAAVAAVDSWPAWPGGCLVIVGPEGVGKSHLAGCWADSAGALRLTADDVELSQAAGRPALLEDADRGVEDETLFHLINLAGREGGGLLVTARRPPILWEAALPDLRSRLNALTAVEIEDPDDSVLEGVLRRFFRERSIRPPEDVYPYLLRRIERSVPQARQIVRLLDEAGDGEFRPVSRLLARQVLDGESQNLDIFDG